MALVVAALAIQGDLLWNAPLLLQVLAINALMLFLPCLLLGTVTPLVAQRTVADLRAAGRTVGTLYAWSTAGAIGGTREAVFVRTP